ncbi:MAG TPA: glycosyltransferase [Solirubrobacterales bacterium]|nr:glycosyltransferase [Solirubrobacterales bacterium]
MRVLFTTRGSSGHLGPLVPFARACERAGHEVRVAAQEQFGANVERAGLPFAPFDAPERDEWMPLMSEFAKLDFQTANAVMIGKFFAGLDVAAGLPRLTTFIEEWRPDVIVRESWEFGSSLVAEVQGVPMARVGLGLAALEDESIRIAAPGVDEARRGLGLPSDPEGVRLREPPYLTMVPESLEDPAGATSGTTHRFRFEADVSPAPLPDWWPGNDDPLVYLTFGSVAAGAHLPYYPQLYRAAIDVLAPLPIRLLVTIGDQERSGEELGPVPANVHVETWVRHDDATAAATVVVCHGGFGSTLGTLAHGRPLVVVPVFSSDQWVNGDAVARVGAGVALADDPTTRAALALPSAGVIAGLADAVRRLLREESYRERAAGVAESMRSLPPVEQAVEVLAAQVR